MTCVEIRECASGLVFEAKSGPPRQRVFDIFDNPNSSLIRTGLGTVLYRLAEFYCTLKLKDYGYALITFYRKNIDNNKNKLWNSAHFLFLNLLHRYCRRLL